MTTLYELATLNDRGFVFVEEDDLSGEEVDFESSFETEE